MSASTSQGGDHIVEVENKKYESFIEENIPKGTVKYIAISPEGDFLVEFIVIKLDSSDSLKFELKMYDIKYFKNEGGSTSKKDSKHENISEEYSKHEDASGKDSKHEADSDGANDSNRGEESSYRKLSSIRTETKLPFTKTQLSFINLIKNDPKPIFRWSVAVSDKSISSSEFRLLAISCISLKDMEYCKELYTRNKLNPTEIQKIKNNGFTLIFIINNDYSISNIGDKESLIEHGGIVKLFYEKNSIADQKEKDTKTVKSSQNIDDHFLILLTLSGIYKYHIENKSTSNIQKLKYPTRIYESFINNMSNMSLFDMSGPTDEIINKLYNEEYNEIYNNICSYIQLCINKHYFLVDTMKEDIKYIELYDLKTNQLVNTFQRQTLSLFKSMVYEHPIHYAISNNGKLLAYLSYSIKGIKIYSIERRLGVSEVWAAWDIFGSLRDFVKLEKQEFMLQFPSDIKNIAESNSCIVAYNRYEDRDKLFIYDELIVDKYFSLKKSDKQVWITRELDKEPKTLGLDKEYEPWLPWIRGWMRFDDIQYSFYLDEKEEMLLIIGIQTVQLWHRRTLKYIHSPYPFSGVPDIKELFLIEWDPKVIEVLDIKYCTEKLKVDIQIKDDKDPHRIKQIKMEGDDIMNIAKHACYALEFYFAHKKKLDIYYDETYKSSFDDFIEQTRKIILKFISLHPTEWRLLDIRFDLMSTLIRAGECELVYYILSFREPIHIPQYFPWPGEKNTINTIRTAFLEDNTMTMLACFLEYYSNNAVHNIGWMNTVIDIIPDLLKGEKGNNFMKSETDLKSEYYKYYVEKLFYSPCFCDKELDLFSFKILEVSPKSNELLKVFIPITQLIPQNSKLNLQEIDFDKVTNLRMVPLADFTMNKKIPDIKKGKLRKFLEILFSPSKYLSPDEILRLRIFEDFAQNLNILFNIIVALRQFLLFFMLIIIAMGHALYILLGYSSYIGLNQTVEEQVNPFSSIISAILAVDAFSDAVKDSKNGLYSYQIDLIHEFAYLEKSLEFNNLDSKFKDKIRAKYICFYDDPRITKRWKKTSKQMKSKPYTKIQSLYKKEYELWSIEDIYSLFY
ncbi:5257_t:CDS:10 [Dentiscutata erythropus]|uniref:5257_t:CDS:1 n=1 Tax=Dentiscutata erythropus TaxID=1348616 RepID=A0A9N8YU86_9GLOM|nr:5257_t:CDS:10 [Dentiscutata erythropus]